MNAKLRSIFNTAWNEPRHFFFWLAILSFCGYAALARATEFAGATLLLAFAALGCILCFLASVPAFILAWIPPVRRFLARLLQRRFLVLACLVTLVALFYATENWRGRHAWQDYERDAQAKGERFTLASLAPPPVPDDQNFFATPLWDDLHFVETNGTVVYRDTNHEHRVVFTTSGPNSDHAPTTGNRMKALPVDLSLWQAFYRGTNNVFEGRSGPPTNYFPIAKEPQSPAADVLLALSRFNDNRQLLEDSAAHPRARFWINYEAGFTMQLPHLPRAKACSQYLALHTVAALKAGERNTAVDDLKLEFRLLDSLRNEPILISHLVRAAMLEIALQPVWEGLADRQWSDADLTVLDSELGKLDFLADFQFALRGERACNLWVVDFTRKAGVPGMDALADPDRKASERAELGRSLGAALFRLIPAGWFDQNKFSICRNYEVYVFPTVEVQQRLVAPGLAEKSQKAIEHLRRRPYDVLSKALLPGMTHAALRFARTQTSVDLARVAVALERYRLANVHFPETLDALTPKFMQNLPHDIINGQPLKYHRTDDGQFILYSVGWNQTDDGGKVELTKSGQADPARGDWVWRYPAT